MIPAWAWTIGWMVVITERVWTSIWMPQMKACLWLEGKRLKLGVFLLDLLQKFLVSIFKAYGSLIVGYAKFCHRRYQDFEWVRKL